MIEWCWTLKMLRILDFSLIRRPTLVKRFVRIRDFSRNTTPCEIWTMCLTALCPYGEVLHSFFAQLAWPHRMRKWSFWEMGYIICCNMCQRAVQGSQIEASINCITSNSYINLTSFKEMTIINTTICPSKNTLFIVDKYY